MRPPPICWDDAASWVVWNYYNSQLPLGSSAAPEHFCADCTQEYKDKMVKAGRCAYPEVRFIQLKFRRVDPHTGKVTMEDAGAVRGVRSKEDEEIWARTWNRE